MKRHAGVHPDDPNRRGGDDEDDYEQEDDRDIANSGSFGSRPVVKAKRKALGSAVSVRPESTVAAGLFGSVNLLSSTNQASSAAVSLPPASRALGFTAPPTFGSTGSQTAQQSAAADRHIGTAANGPENALSLIKTLNSSFTKWVAKAAASEESSSALWTPALRKYIEAADKLEQALAAQPKDGAKDTQQTKAADAITAGVFGSLASAPAAAPAGGFSFGASSTAPAAEAPAPAVAPLAFSFGAQKGPSPFGTTAAAAPKPAAPAPAPATAAGGFSFGATAPSISSPASAPAAAEVKPTGGFSFSFAPASAPASAPAPAAASFSFGAPAPAPSPAAGDAKPAAGGFNFSFGAAPSSTSASAPAPASAAFSFGAAAPSPAPAAAAAASKPAAAPVFAFGGAPVAAPPAFSFGSAPAPAPAASASAPSAPAFSFGAPAPGGFQFGAAVPAPAAAAAASGADGGEGGDDEDGEDEGVQLEAATSVTAKLLVPDESLVLEVQPVGCKRFDTKAKEWKDLDRGVVRIAVTGATGKARLIFSPEGVARALINAALDGQAKIETVGQPGKTAQVQVTAVAVVPNVDTPSLTKMILKCKAEAESELTKAVRAGIAGTLKK